MEKYKYLESRLKILIFLIFIPLFSCAYIDLEGMDSFEKEIISLTIQAAKNSASSVINITGIIDSDSVTINVPFGTSLNLTPTIAIKGKSISPGSGETQTFVDGVGLPYTVVAQDDSTKTYMVTVHVASAVEKEITAFAFLKTENPSLPNNLTGTISGTAIYVPIPPGTNTGSLIPTVLFTGVSLNPPNNTACSFPEGSGVPYTVTAGDDSTKTYTVTVYEPPVPVSGILNFNRIDSTSLAVDWTKSTDTQTPEANLQYLLYYSTSNNIDTIADIEANGTPFGTYSTEITATVTGLNESAQYYFNVIVRDEDNNKTSYLSGSYTMLEIIPPAQVVVTNLTEGNGQVNIQWTDPGDLDFDHIEITRIPDGTGINTIGSGIQDFTVTGLTNETEYTFSIFSVDMVGNRSSAVTVKTVPSTTGPHINYCIYTADDLNAVRGGIKTGWDKTGSYIMMADIDLSTYSPWTPIGTSSSDVFSGNFNGNGYGITGLYINTSSDYQGLFGYVEGPVTIKNIQTLDCDISGGKYTAGLAGYFFQNGTGAAAISDCHISGSIIGLGMYIGGLAGQLGTANSVSEVTGCSVNATVGVSSAASASAFLGGLVGRVDGLWTVLKCYTKGNIINTDASLYIGGLMGFSDATTRDSYARTNVIGRGKTGGLIGGSTGQEVNCYATGDIAQGGVFVADFGGLLGNSSSAAPTSFYCGTLVGSITDNTCGNRKTGTEMKQESTYTGWDFTTVWGIDGTVNNGFPYLRSNLP